MAEKLLNICGNNIIKSRIVGWKRSTDEKHNHCMDILLDSGNALKVLVQTWIYDRQYESNQQAEEKYEKLEVYLTSEFNIDEGV
jgi:hypothetical protein